MVYIFGREHFPTHHIFLMAVATSFANILFTSASSVLAHHRRGSVDWMIVRRMAPGIVIGTLAGTRFAAHAPTVLLEEVFVAFLAFVSTQMLFGRKREASGVLPGKAMLTSASMAIGGLASLVGIGGAALTVPLRDAGCDSTRRSARPRRSGYRSAALQRRLRLSAGATRPNGCRDAGCALGGEARSLFAGRQVTMSFRADALCHRGQDGCQSVLLAISVFLAFVHPFRLKIVLWRLTDLDRQKAAKSSHLGEPKC